MYGNYRILYVIGEFMLKFDDKKAVASKGISLQEKQSTGQLMTTIPSIFKDNGLDWKGGDELEFYYDKSSDMILVKRPKTPLGRALVLPNVEMVRTNG